MNEFVNMKIRRLQLVDTWLCRLEVVDNIFVGSTFYPYFPSFFESVSMFFGRFHCELLYTERKHDKFFGRKHPKVWERACEEASGGSIVAWLISIKITWNNLEKRILRIFLSSSLEKKDCTLTSFRKRLL